MAHFIVRLLLTSAMNLTFPSQSRFAALATPELSEPRASARRAEPIMLLPFAFEKETPKPNHAPQPTATLAVSCRRAAPGPTGSVTAGAPTMKPGTCRAFASRRRALTRALRSRWLSLRSLGDLHTFL